MGYEFDFGALLQHVGLFAKGIAVTLGLTAVSSLVGICIGVAGAAALRSKRTWLMRIVFGYVELIRNTPFIVQMFFIFFGLPSLGFRLSALAAAALAMTINLAAYAIEIVRAGLEGVPQGQTEAARTLGLGAVTTFVLVLLPQAIANVYPALISQITITMLESAVVSQIAVVDLTHVADFIQSRNFRSFEVYLVVTIIYLVLAIAIRRLMVFAGRGLFEGRVR
jgi:polar amino acid transport system permease protein